MTTLTTTFYTVATGKTAVFRDWFFYNGGGAAAIIQLYTLIDAVQLPFHRITVAAASSVYLAMRLCLESGHALRTSSDRGSACNFNASGALLAA
jgi:hypothetical protein